MAQMTDNTEKSKTKVGTKERIKAMSTSELADYFGISRHTMRKWILNYADEIGQRINFLWSPKQVQKILQIFDAE